MAETETKKRTGLGALADAGNTDDFSVIDAIGGPRGVIRVAGDRALVPTTVRHGSGVRLAGSRYLPDLGMEQSRSS